ncbi:hypothetical protein [Liberiplasma polymorphum]|uniref:hypothetical protein n=1 Tax=Liberiplasma polymorphum TaxID=3374570 RepID=UPI0037761564
MEDYKEYDLDSLYEKHFQEYITLMTYNRNNAVVRHQVYYFLLVNGIINIDMLKTEQIVPLIQLKDYYANMTKDNLEVDWEQLEIFRKKCKDKYNEVNKVHYVEEHFAEDLILLNKELEYFYGKGEIQSHNDFLKKLKNYKGDE